ncbi:penicillin amidase [Deinobacterium chartae]|uniref:Penicillin amidase n=1 Tax=Deinobacterium chartae TaxID=521158 RepID=A0A841I1X2_9DEIO|nr:penicillin acylase family protein [Deinobacterium chartae]MBB6098984.1 penicillin amidase [Deinobacterium chartae]
MRILRVLGALLALLLLAVVALIAYAFWQGYSPTRGTLHLEGLSGPVTVSRDPHGIPLIHAERSDEDAVFALGYVHAQDRLWQMEFQRRIAQGRLSEMLGEAALEQDKFLRTWGFYRAAQTVLPALDDRSRRLVRAYTAGVNAFLDTGKRPLEFLVLNHTPERWTEVDSVAWSKLMAFDLGGNYEDEILAARLDAKLGESARRVLMPPYPAAAPTILARSDLEQSGLLEQAPQDASSDEVAQALLPQTLRNLEAHLEAARRLGFERFEGKGSNNWVISGRFTESGKPLLADDPHLSLQAPALWYLAELRGPTLRVVGATIPGLPAMVIGRNDRVAWGVTNVNPDVQDLYLEPDGARLTTRTEVIRVKGQPDVRLEVQESEHGPIISQAGAADLKQRVSLRWTALQPGDTTMDAFIGINYARNWQDFTAALRRYVAPSQSFVYADIDGNIGYYAPGRIPIRQGYDGSLPARGDGSNAWTGYIPFEKLPHVYNPQEGFVVTANNRVVGPEYAYSLGNDAIWALPYRAQRIRERIEQAVQSGRKLTVQDMQDIQMDSVSLIWRDLSPFLTRVEPQDTASKRLLNTLANWDGDMSEDSAAATAFAFWFRELIRMPADELGEDFGPYWNNALFVQQQLREDGRFCRDATARDCTQFLQQSLSRAAQALEARLGSSPQSWRWGGLHRVLSQHGAFADIPVLGNVFNRSQPNRGGIYTVNVAAYDQETFVQTKGPSYRHVVDLGNLEASRFVHSLGQSGSPFSPHYADLAPLWRGGRYLPMGSATGGDVLTLQPPR